MHQVGVGKVSGTLEECLQTTLCAGDDSSVISEQQTAQHSNDSYEKQIASASALLCSSHDALLIHINYSLVQLLLAAGLLGLADFAAVCNNLLESELAVLEVLADALVE